MESRPRVTDLETSKKLVKWMGGCETEKVWHKQWHYEPAIDEEGNACKKEVIDGWELIVMETEYDGCTCCVPAYTTDDLMERLPKVIHEKEDRPTEKLYIDFNRGLAGYSATDDILGFTHSRKIAYFESTVELRSALAQLVLFCGESGYLEEGKG